MKYSFWTFLFIMNFGRVSAQNESDKPGWDADATGDYVVKHYNSENGLPQNSAKDLLLDRKKFLWIATEDGLVRFDGQRFKVYNTSNTPILKSNRFSIITEGTQHEVLLGSSYDRNEIFKATSVISIDTAYTRLPHKSITQKAIGVFDFANLFRHSSVNNNPAIDTILLNEICKSQDIEMLTEHELVIGYKQNMYYLNNVTAEMLILPVNPGRRFATPFFAGDVFCYPAKSNELLFFRHGKPVAVEVDKSVTELFAGFPTQPYETELQVYTKNNLLLCRRHNDIYRLSLSNNVLKAELLFKNLSFLDKLFVSAFQYDKEAGRLFVGTLNAGLFVISRKMFNTLLFNSPDLNDNVFMAFRVLPNGKLLSSNGILDKAGDGKNRLFDKDKPDRLCIYTAADKSVWMSKNGILSRYDSNFLSSAPDAGLSLGDVATCITEDHEHSLWVSTGFALFRVNGDKLSFGIGLFPRIQGHAIESIAEVEPGILWIATRRGLYSFDIARQKMNSQPLLPNVYARCIFKAKDGSLWIGTYGNGYYKYDHGGFVRLPLDTQKYLANTHAFLEDEKGFFWITTNHGLFKIRKADLDSFIVSKDINDVYFYYFDKSYGFNTNEFNGGCSPAGQADREGNFYFPSLNGIVYFNPGKVQTELPRSAIFIDNFQVGALSIDYRKPIKIKPDFDQMFVDVATPFFGLNDNLNLVYKLNTVGEKWTPVNADGRIIINRLPYGKYSLLIRKREGWGRNAFTTTSIDFEVLPYWYNTKLFNVLLGALLLVFVVIVFKIRTRILKRQNVRLQENVEQRTFELNQSTLMKEKLISVIVHDLRSPLASHSFLIDYLYSSHDKLPPGEIDELFFQLKESSDRISYFSRDFLTWYNSQKQGWEVRPMPIALDKFLVQTASFYREMALRKNIGFVFDIPPGLELISDEYILSIVVRNLVDNAVKYTRTGCISLAAFRKGAGVCIQVKDTGQGMPASRIKELMEYVDIDINKAKPTFGYLFILEFTRKLGGRITIESEQRTGTMVTVILGSS